MFQIIFILSYTEKLHALADLPVEDVIKQKQQIIDYRRATQTYCDHLMKGIESNKQNIFSLYIFFSTKR